MDKLERCMACGVIRRGSLLRSFKFILNKCLFNIRMAIALTIVVFTVGVLCGIAFAYDGIS